MQLTASVYKTDRSFMGSFIVVPTTQFNPEHGRQEAGFAWQVILARTTGTISGTLCHAEADDRVELIATSGAYSGAFEGFTMPMREGQAFVFVHPRGPRLRCVVSSFVASARPRVMAQSKGTALSQFLADC
jgi:hypothetical protein